MSKTRFPSALIVFIFLLFLPLHSVLALSPESDEEDGEWDAIVEELAEELHLPGEFALGYRNTVTGEEHYYNGDREFVAASLYKLPLNMIYAERVGKGEMEWEDTVQGMEYADIQRRSLTYSSNRPSEALLGELGGWAPFRALCAEYLGEDSEDEQYLSGENLFTARQLCRCTALLLEEPDRFPGVVECLMDSAPGQFLEYADVPFDIAQKYGNLTIGKLHFFHVSGLVFTEEPIALTVLTLNVGNQRGLMSEYCRRMCSYAESRSAPEAEAAEAGSPTKETR